MLVNSDTLHRIIVFCDVSFATVGTTGVPLQYPPPTNNYGDKERSVRCMKTTQELTSITDGTIASRAVHAVRASE